MRYAILADIHAHLAALQAVLSDAKGQGWTDCIFDKWAAARSLQFQFTQVCFFGHTHIPMAFVRDSVVRGGTYSRFKVEARNSYLINPGSVGQPRDGDRRAAYAIYDLEKESVELRRVECPPPGVPPLSGGDGDAPVPRRGGGPRPSLGAAAEPE